jgi:hypothetical protein
MAIDVVALQELQPMEEAGLAAAGCCWNSAVTICPPPASFLVTTCHTCTNTF